jgi:Tfp pilus assembly protein PilO
MSLWRRIFAERRRVILPIVIVLVANVAVLLLAVLPLQTSVTGAESSAFEAMATLDLARRGDKQARDAKASKDRAEQELKKFYEEKLPKELNTARKVTTAWLVQAAADAGVSFKGLSLDYNEVRDSRLTRVVVKFTLQGRYASVRKFLYNVETAEEFVVVEKVELAQTGADTPATSGLLELGLTVSTYFLTPAGS